LTRGRAVALLAAGAVLISFSPVFVRLAHVAPTVSAFYRMAIGGLVLGAWAATRQRRALDRRYLSICLLLGLVMAFDLAVWHRAIGLVGPGLATLLGNLQVLLVAGYAVAVEGERPSPPFWLALPLAVIGLVMVFGLQSEMSGPEERLGLLLGILTAVSYAIFLVVLRGTQSRRAEMDAATTVALFSLMAAALLGGATLIEGETFSIPDGQTLAALLGLGLVSQVVGWVLISRSLPHVETSRAGLLLLLQPGLAYCWDVGLFGRRPGPVELTGVGLMLVGIYLGMMSDQKKPPAPATDGATQPVA